MDIGASSNNRILVGQYKADGTNGLIVYKSTSTQYAHNDKTALSPTVNKIKFHYNGGDYTYTLNNVDKTVSNQSITLSKLIHIEGGSSSSNILRNIKIKAL